MSADAGVYPADGLEEKISIERAEADNPGLADRRAADGRPADRSADSLAADWDRLKASMQPGDEIWTFGTPSSAWQRLAGRDGIALVRAGRIVDAIVTMMS